MQDRQDQTCSSFRFLQKIAILVREQRKPADIRGSHERVICIVDDEARLAAVWLFHVFTLQVVDFHFVIITSFGVISGKASSLFKCTVRQFFPVRLDNDMRAGNALSMKPPVAACGKLERQLIILKIVFSNINMEAIRGEIMERLAFCLDLLAGVSFFDVAELCQLLFDLGKVIFGHGYIQRG